MNIVITAIPACAVAGAILALAACAAAPAVPETLRPGANETLAMVVAAKGVQIYECRAKGAAHEWAFVAPEAELFDARGVPVGWHGAGPTWEAVDGSRVKGAVKARADAPNANAIPWLLLATRNDGPAGAFSAVSSIQRVNTAGGLPPPHGCTRETAGKQARVNYAADYRFFTAR